MSNTPDELESAMILGDHWSAEPSREALRFAIEKHKVRAKSANARADAAESEVRRLRSELDWAIKQHQLLYNGLHSSMQCHPPVERRTR